MAILIPGTRYFLLLLLISGCRETPEQVAMRFINRSDCEFHPEWSYLCEYQRATTDPEIKKDIVESDNQEIDESISKKDELISTEKLEKPESARIFRSMKKYKLKSVSVDNEIAEVTIEKISPEIHQYVAATHTIKSLNYKEKLEKAAVEYLRGGNVKMVTADLKLKLRLEDGKWKVVLDLKKKRETKEENRLNGLMSKYQLGASINGLTLSGTTPEELKKSLCEQLAAKLPISGESRKTLAERYKKLYDCQDPGPATIPPQNRR